MEGRVFEHEREDHVFNLTVELVRSHGILPVNRALQVDSSSDEEDTGGGPILVVGNRTEYLDADQPEDHYIAR